MTGILGAIALILAFVGFGSLPLDVAGVVLIGLAVVLFLLVHRYERRSARGRRDHLFVLGAFALCTAPGSPTAPMSRWRPR